MVVRSFIVFVCFCLGGVLLTSCGESSPLADDIVEGSSEGQASEGRSLPAQDIVDGSPLLSPTRKIESGFDGPPNVSVLLAEVAPFPDIPNPDDLEEIEYRIEFILKEVGLSSPLDKPLNITFWGNSESATEELVSLYQEYFSGQGVDVQVSDELEDTISITAQVAATDKHPEGTVAISLLSNSGIAPEGSIHILTNFRTSAIDSTDLPALSSWDEVASRAFPVPEGGTIVEGVTENRLGIVESTTYDFGPNVDVTPMIAEIKAAAEADGYEVSEESDEDFLDISKDGVRLTYGSEVDGLLAVTTLLD